MLPARPKLDDRPFWLSFQSAFLNGCCDALGIDFNDLGATFNGWTDESWVGELVVYGVTTRMTVPPNLEGSMLEGIPARWILVLAMRGVPNRELFYGVVCG